MASEVMDIGEDGAFDVSQMEELSIQEEPTQPTQSTESHFNVGNVRLPMLDGYHCRGSDSDEEFQDAFEDFAAMSKNIAKAKEMKEEGNASYVSGSYEDALSFYSLALEYAPEDGTCNEDRAVYYCNRAACSLHLKEYEEVVNDCSQALELKEGYMKALTRRAQAYEALEKYDLALEDMKEVSKLDPAMRLARDAVPRLQRLHDEKMQKMKDEALGKLKDLGNSLLGHVGLSLDNFKMQQDPNTGSYNINFSR
ncbi:unnamed protein product [Chrysoparadoxa australica]